MRKSSPAKSAPARKAAFVGLGDMGLPMAKNLLKAGFTVAGFDLRAARRRELQAAGGIAAASCREAARGAEAAFVMVMNGAQAVDAVAGKDGLLAGLGRGATIFLTATIARDEAAQLAPLAEKRGVDFVDSPVSGGQHGALAGSLTFMTAGKRKAIEARKDFLLAMGKSMHYAGKKPGDGQTAKASLQALVGGVFASAFEALVLGAKAGLDGEVLAGIFNHSVVASPLLANCTRLVLARKFKNTGSRIQTMRKDLGLTGDLARQVGAPVFVSSAARELFQAAATRFPDEDNWCVVKLLEEIAGVEVRGAKSK